VNIDVHAHSVTPSIVRAAKAGETLHGVGFGETTDGKLTSRCGSGRSTLPWPDYAHSIEDRLERMDEAGVDAQVLSLSPALFWYQSDAADAVRFARVVNDELAEVVRSNPSRFAAFAYLPLQDPHAAADELARCVRELGHVGAIVGTNVNGADWDHAGLRPVLQAAEELQALVFMHPTRIRGSDFLGRFHLRNLIGNPLDTTVAFSSMVFGGVFDRYPDLRVCLAHGGGYSCLGVSRLDHGYRVRPEARDAATPPSAYLRRIYVDSLVHSDETLRLVVDRVDSDRVFLGTDYPADMGQPNPAQWIDGCASLTSAEKQAILGDNFLRLFPNQFSKDALPA
jgi:aminocarboxymuconate-semialdehyde decarboxylase